MSPTNFLSICHFPTYISSLTSSRIHRSFQHVTWTKLQLLTLYSNPYCQSSHLYHLRQPRSSTTCTSLFLPSPFYCNLHSPRLLSLFPISDSLQVSLFIQLIMQNSFTDPELCGCFIHFSRPLQSGRQWVHKKCLLNNHTLGIPNVRIIFLGISF